MDKSIFFSMERDRDFLCYLLGIIERKLYWKGNFEIILFTVGALLFPHSFWVNCFERGRHYFRK